MCINKFIFWRLLFMVEKLRKIFYPDPVVERNDHFLYYKRILILSTFTAVLLFIPFLIESKGVFLYYGDYNAQQIPFYRHCVEMVHKGEIGWDWYTDLGSNFVGSYSYYLLGSPYFWLMCLFPASWAPYLMAPIYVLKFVTAAVFSFAYLKRFVKNQDYAIIGALLYAFSGFGLYNIFFNQFHEVIAFFPLLLIGMEELIQNDRKGLFAIAVFTNACMNYFMFAGQVVFCIIYFMIRCSSRPFKITIKKFFLLAFESIIGVMLSAVIFLPAAYGVLDNPRVSNYYQGIENLIYRSGGKVFWNRYLSIIECFFFPPDIPSRKNFIVDENARWSSLTAWLPLFGMTGVISYIKERKATWVSSICVILIVMALVPVGNAAFFLLNRSFYARWYYMMILMMTLATIIAIDKKVNFKSGLIVNGFVCALFTVFLGFVWVLDEDSKELNYILGKPAFLDRFWIYVFIAFACILATFIIMKYYRGKPMFNNILTYSLILCILFYGWLHIFYGKCHSWGTNFILDQAIGGWYEMDISGAELADKEETDTEDKFTSVQIEGNGFERIDTFDGSFDNLGLYWHEKSMRCFHTVVPPSIMTAYPEISGVSRSVGSRADAKYFGLRSFFSVKYYYIETSKESKFDAKGFNLYGYQNGFTIYENENYIPIGFFYDSFMRESEFDKISVESRHMYLTQYLVVPDEYAQEVSKYLPEVLNKDIVSLTTHGSSSYDIYVQNCIDRANSSCETFEYDSNGFKATTKYLEKPNYVFFSVPNESGWSAKVNGKDAEIINAFFGFMAVKCDEGVNEIVFEYETPGLKYGFIITIVGLLIFSLYLFIVRKGNKSIKSFFTERYYESDNSIIDKKQISSKEDYGLLNE